MELSSKALKGETECDKIKKLYELFLDINFVDDISKDKKEIIMKLKGIFLKTKNLNEIKENIKKIFDDNKKYFVNTFFIKFLYIFFEKDEYFFLRLIYGSYKHCENPNELLNKKYILEIEYIMITVISYAYDEIFFGLVFKNVSSNLLNEILKRFCVENNKKNEIFTNYIKYKNLMDNFIYKKIIIRIVYNFINSNFEIFSLHFYCIIFGFHDRIDIFISRILEIRKIETYNEKFKEYRNHFDNKEGILQYLNNNQYLI